MGSADSLADRDQRHSGLPASILEKSIDTVLMEMQMPLMDGLEAAAAVKKKSGKEARPFRSSP